MHSKKSMKPRLGSGSPVRNSNMRKSSDFPPHFHPKPGKPVARTELKTLREEVKTLKHQLSSTIDEISLIKTRCEQESNDLKSSYDDLVKELEILRFEKDERDIKQHNSLEEYSKLALELIQLRTEIDRLAYLHDREVRNSQIKIQKSFKLNKVNTIW